MKGRVFLSIALMAMLVSVSFYSLFVGMRQQMTMPTVTCFHASTESAPCPMSIADHIAYWRMLFMTHTPEQTSMLLLLAGAMIALLYVMIQNLWRNRLLMGLPRGPSRDPCTRIFQPLFFAFQKGIVHSRLYA